MTCNNFWTALRMQLSYMATQHTVERHVTITAWSGRQEECARSSDARLFHFKKADSQLHTLCVYYEPWSGTWKRYSKIWGNLLALTARTHRFGSFFEFCISLQWRVDELSYLVYQLVPHGSSSATHAPVNAAALATPVWSDSHSWIFSAV